MAIIHADVVRLRRDEYRQLIETIDALKHALRARVGRNSAQDRGECDPSSPTASSGLDGLTPLCGAAASHTRCIPVESDSHQSRVEPTRDYPARRRADFAQQGDRTLAMARSADGLGSFIGQSARKRRRSMINSLSTT